MANVDLKVGDYTIPPLSTNTFTFWWPDRGLSAFFDVSVTPEANDATPNIAPLVEVRRERGLTKIQRDTFPLLLLTLQNNNNFPVKFFASHVRIS